MEFSDPGRNDKAQADKYAAVERKVQNCSQESMLYTLEQLHTQ